MAESSRDGSGDRIREEESEESPSGKKLTTQLLKIWSGEFELDSIFHLKLKEKDIFDLGAIGTCSNLQRLDVSRNDLTDLRPLILLKQLVYLNIAANRISALDPLKHLENLESLNAAGNLLSSFDSVYCLATLQNLKDLRFQDPLQEWTNPICQGTSYHSTMTSHFCHLRMLDGERMSGQGSEVYTVMRQLDRTVAKLEEPSADHTRKKISSAWITEGFWESNVTQDEKSANIEEAENKLRDLILDCRQLGNSALHRIQKS
ncbi:leucine-rich repeat-containing protein 61-like [Diadema antillarum]|uniref:leucine-rich repeat-containing protein 61-like n=2 Tax=Diadema antillarum TaxID=105358 RepID=UPI003A8B7291